MAVSAAAYSRLVLPAVAGSREAGVLAAMEGFCRAWAPFYDVVFYCCDSFSQQQDGDPYRARVLDLQPAADRVVRQTCAAVGQKVIDIPPGMTTAERVDWMDRRAHGQAQDRPPAQMRSELAAGTGGIWGCSG